MCEQGTTNRCNGTILASDDNGATFSRSLRLWPGGFGYTGLACGLRREPLLADEEQHEQEHWAQQEQEHEEEDDCAVAFDSMSHGLYLLKFKSGDVK